MSEPLEFLAGGGKTGALLRANDWADSPLGPPESWPQSLRTVVGLLLQSRFPMFVAWGQELGFLYNDSYAEILGTKHPHALVVVQIRDRQSVGSRHALLDWRVSEARSRGRVLIRR